MMSEVRWAFKTTSWKPSKVDVLKCLSSIHQIEIDRIQKFRFKNDWKLSLIGRLLIRLCISKLCDIKWCNIDLSRDDKGKPILLNKVDKPIFFNVAHQGDFTVLAGSINSNIGIDVMKYVYPNNINVASYFKLMKKQFTNLEWDFINSFAIEFDKLKAFYRLWCLKESYVKAVGSGIGTLSANYMRFDVKTKNLNVDCGCFDTELYLQNEKSNWVFQENLLDEDHVVSVASDCFVNKDFIFLDIDEILSHVENVTPVHNEWWIEYENKIER